ncbi:PIN domain-containing protein [Pseudomonas sp. NPDC007930]|uniref:type II toxin-antitoxin system VapC family toxin n=1 Tax=Pseudomonas sp. NPDC007930 TaxID=3364417 RepID=UPI0036F04FB3
MKWLVDTHLLLWHGVGHSSTPRFMQQLWEDPSAEIFFSAAAVWEVAIKAAKSGAEGSFPYDPHVVHDTWLSNGLIEVPISAHHARLVTALPPIHRDPFDRIMIAQAMIEGFTLVTHDHSVAQYPGPIRHV